MKSVNYFLTYMKDALDCLSSVGSPYKMVRVNKINKLHL